MALPERDAWIETVDELYRAEKDRYTGAVDNVLKVHSLHPETLRAHIDLYRTVMYGNSRITRTEREMIGVVVLQINNDSEVASPCSILTDTP